MHGAPTGPGARTRDLPRARRGSPAARHGGGLEPGTCCVLGEGPQLHAMGLFRQASLSVPIDRVGRLRNTRAACFGDSFCTILYDFIVLGLWVCIVCMYFMILPEELGRN